MSELDNLSPSKSKTKVHSKLCNNQQVLQQVAQLVVQQVAQLIEVVESDTSPAAASLRHENSASLTTTAAKKR